MPKLINEKGNKYGSWVVLSKAGRTNCGFVDWNCRCECGIERIVSGHNLRSGHSKSCGCLHTRPKGVSACKNIISVMKFNSIRRGIEFAISERYLKSLHKKDCIYCGSSPREMLGKRLNGGYKCNGIDRINNDLGYIESNVAPCCSICNYMKKTMDSKDFINAAKKITEYQEKTRS